jgi:hypothetical protein
MDFSAHSIIWTLIIGLVIGAIAKLLMPGKDPGGCIITILLGIAGRIRRDLDRPHFCGRELRRWLDHVRGRRNDPVVAISIAFQARRIGAGRCGGARRGERLYNQSAPKPGEGGSPAFSRSQPTTAFALAFASGKSLAADK